MFLEQLNILDKSQAALDFVKKYKSHMFYQPVVFSPGVLEIRGKWHEATTKMADDILRDVCDKTVVDLGCNVGFFIHEAHKRGARHAVGIDFDPSVIEIAKELNEIFQAPCDFLFEDACKHHEEYDVVLILNLLHVIKDPITFLAKFWNQTRREMIVEIDKDQESLLLPYSSHMSIQDSPRACSWRKLARIRKDITGE